MASGQTIAVAADSARVDLAALVGESRVVADSEGCRAYSVDGHAPGCVVYPTSADAAAAVLEYASGHELAVIPCRNATKLGTGNPPRRYDVALSLKDMNRVWYYEPDDLVVSVEPGMKFGDLQHLAARHGLWLPLDPRGGARASMGGIVATNSSGPLRVRYGAPRDMVLGMKIATAGGKVVSTGGRVVKNVAGYDVAKLLAGSYGTLGVIVEVTFKLFPQVAERATFVLDVADLDAARELRRRLQSSPLRPLRVTLLNGPAARLAGRTGTAPFQLWIEAGGSAQVIARYARELEGLGRDGGGPVERLGDSEAERGWAVAADPAASLVTEHPELVVLRATLPIAAAESFLDRAGAEGKARHGEVASLSEVGVGVVHLCLPGLETSQAAACVEALRAAAVDLGGALIVERCPTELKPRVDAWGPAGDGFEVMGKIKAAWDPKGTLSPGRFIGRL